MSERELDLFVKKVSELRNLVDSLDEIPERRQLLARCDNHDQVVSLASQWGFNIGRRWGDEV